MLAAPPIKSNPTNCLQQTTRCLQPVCCAITTVVVVVALPIFSAGAGFATFGIYGAYAGLSLGLFAAAYVIRKLSSCCVRSTPVNQQKPPSEPPQLPVDQPKAPLELPQLTPPLSSTRDTPAIPTTPLDSTTPSATQSTPAKGKLLPALVAMTPIVQQPPQHIVDNINTTQSNPQTLDFDSTFGTSVGQPIVPHSLVPIDTVLTTTMSDTAASVSTAAAPTLGANDKTDESNKKTNSAIIAKMPPMMRSKTLNASLKFYHHPKPAIAVLPKIVLIKEFVTQDEERRLQTLKDLVMSSSPKLSSYLARLDDKTLTISEEHLGILLSCACFQTSADTVKAIVQHIESKTEAFISKAICHTVKVMFETIVSEGATKEEQYFLTICYNFKLINSYLGRQISKDDTFNAYRSQIAMLNARAISAFDSQSQPLECLDLVYEAFKALFIPD